VLIGTNKYFYFILQKDNYEFNQLPVNDQAGYTWENGTYLATRLEVFFQGTLAFSIGQLSESRKYK